MGWAETDQSQFGRCKKHPNHSQSEGVCSNCLTEKLAKLNKNGVSGGGGGAVGSCSSSAFSSCSLSPANRGGGHHRNASEVMVGSISFMVSVSDGLKKSRSVASSVPRNRVGEAKGKKKSGFWSKLLLRSTGKRNNKEVLMRPRKQMVEE